VKEGKASAPLGEERPEKDGRLRRDNGRRAFCEDSEAEEETEEDGGQPGIPRKDRSVFVRVRPRTTAAQTIET